MPIARWSDDDSSAVDADTVRRLLTEVSAAAKQPIVVTLEADGAELGVVVGDPTGTALTYCPPGYF